MTWLEWRPVRGYEREFEANGFGEIRSATNPDQRWLTIDQSVERLAAVDVTRTPATIRSWISDGYLPARKLGRRVIVAEQALMEAERDTRLRRQAALARFAGSI